MKFWPLPLLRNYPTSAEITRVFLRFSEDPSIRLINAGLHFTTVAIDGGRLRFWSGNPFYAWGDRGTFQVDDDVEREWHGAMPSRYGVRRMEKALNRLSCVSYPVIRPTGGYQPLKVVGGVRQPPRHP